MKPTLIIDEADFFIRNNDELRGILNSGHNKSTAYVIRTHGENYEPRSFSTWTPKVIALIGNVTNPHGPIYRHQHEGNERKDEKVKISTGSDWKFSQSQQVSPAMGQRPHRILIATDPFMPEGANDRMTDNRRPLLAIADVAGDEWPSGEVAMILLSGAANRRHRRNHVVGGHPSAFQATSDRQNCIGYSC